LRSRKLRSLCEKSAGRSGLASTSASVTCLTVRSAACAGPGTTSAATRTTRCIQDPAPSFVARSIDLSYCIPGGRPLYQWRSGCEAGSTATRQRPFVAGGRNYPLRSFDVADAPCAVLIHQGDATAREAESMGDKLTSFFDARRRILVCIIGIAVVYDL